MMRQYTIPVPATMGDEFAVNLLFRKRLTDLIEGLEHVANCIDNALSTTSTPCSRSTMQSIFWRRCSGRTEKGCGGKKTRGGASAAPSQGKDMRWQIVRDL